MSATSSEMAPFLGAYGFLDISDTAAHAGPFTCVRAVSGDAVGAFAMSVGSSLTAFTIDGGDWLFGPLKTVTLTSGRVLAYY